MATSVSQASTNHSPLQKNQYSRTRCLCNLGRSLTLDPIMVVVAEVICVGYVLTGSAFWVQWDELKKDPAGNEVEEDVNVTDRFKMFGRHLLLLITTPFNPIVLMLISVYGLIVSPSQAHSALTKLSDSKLFIGSYILANDSSNKESSIER